MKRKNKDRAEYKNMQKDMDKSIFLYLLSAIPCASNIYELFFSISLLEILTEFWGIC